MVDVDDTNGLSKRLAQQYRLLEEAHDAGDVDAADYDAILNHVANRRADDSLGDTTVANDLQNLRLAAVRADTPLVDMDSSDVNRLKHTLETEYGVGNGIEAYKRALRVFFDQHLGREWVNDCGGLRSADIREGEQYDPRDALSKDDITTLLEALDNPRDRALTAFLAHTGVRIGLATSLRVKDVYDLNTEFAVFRPNPDGPIKDVPVQDYPINGATLYLRRYLNEAHPGRDRADFDEWPLFCKRIRVDHDNPQENALHTESARKVYRKLRDAEVVDKPCNPHNFRHSLVTRMLAEGHDSTDLMTQFAWSASNLEEMIDYYQGLTRDDRLKRMWRNAGITVAEDDPEDRGDRECHNCGHDNSPTADFCERCSAAISREAKRRTDRVRAAKQQATDEAIGSTDPEMIAKLSEFLNAVDDPGEAARALDNLVDD
jgi:integrase